MKDIYCKCKKSEVFFVSDQYTEAHICSKCGKEIDPKKLKKLLKKKI